jgi:hypothetical protein
LDIKIPKYPFISATIAENFCEGVQGNGNGVINNLSGTVSLAFASLASVHVSLVGRIDSIGLVGISDLDHFINHNGLGLISSVDCTRPDVFIGRTLICHISLVGSIGNISLVGLGGFGGVIGFGLIASSASAASLARRLIGFVDLVGRNDLADHIGLDLIGHNGPIGNIGLGFVGFISLFGFVGMPHCPHWSHHHMSLVGQISLVSISGLIDRNGLVSLIGLGVASLVGFISLIGHIGLVGCIGHNGLVGVIGLSLGSLVGIVSLIGFGLVSLIGLDRQRVCRPSGSDDNEEEKILSSCFARGCDLCFCNFFLVD